MAILSKKLLNFDKKDVDIMNEMLLKFIEYKKGCGMPDFSTNLIGYFPVLTLALLKSQMAIEKLTLVLLILTVVLAVISVIAIFASL